MSEYWPRERFLHGDHPAGPCPESIDLTGRRRILVFGPYVELDPGRWRLTAEFSLTREAAANPLQVEICEDTEVKVAKLIQPSEAGRYRVALECDLTGGRVELRVWLPSPAFDGEMRFSGALVEALSSSAHIGQ